MYGKSNEFGIVAIKVNNFGIQILIYKKAQFGGKGFWVKKQKYI
jgi:hypothetical protein